MRKLLVTLALLFAPALTFGVACPAGYTATETIRIPPQGNMSASTLTYQFYFPGHASMASVANGGYVDNGDTTGLGVVFCDSTGTNVVAYELVPGTYSATTGLGEWHVSVTLSKSAETDLVVKVGKASAADMSCGPSGTNNCGSTLWDGFLDVQHFGTSGTLTLTDSSATNTITNHSATAVAGKLNGGVNFVAASTQYLSASTNVNSATISTMVWVNPTTLASCQVINGNNDNTNGWAFFMGMNSSGTCTGNGSFVLQATNASANYAFVSTPTISAATWSLIGATQTGTTQVLYLNGASVAGSHFATAKSIGTSTHTYGIGAYTTPGAYFNGSVDEVRVYNGVLSADYYAETYANQNSPSNFYTMSWRAPAHFYLNSSTGSDSNNGTSTGTAWQTVSKVNSYAISPGFVPGDEISFNGGQSFTGPIQIPSTSSGSSTGSITIDSYGTGQATINSGNGVIDGITLTDTEFMVINNLIFTGTGWTGSGTGVTVLNGGTGINFLVTKTTGQQLRNNTVSGNTVSGYQFGITFDSRPSASLIGFQNVTINNNNVSANLTGGIFWQGYGALTASAPTDQFKNVYVGYNYAKAIPGDPNSGTGGVHGSVKTEAWAINGCNTTGTVIERNTNLNIAGYGGAISGLANGGSAAIQLCDSRNFTINHNEIGTTRSSGAADGAAIDLDHNTQVGEVAYNLCYQNQGSCVQMGSWDSLGTTGIVHHNISYNDARGAISAEQGAFRFWEGTTGIYVLNNTCYLNLVGTTGTPACISFDQGRSGGADTGVVIANNILQTTGGVAMFYSTSGTPIGSLSVIGNVYDSSGASLVIANSGGGSPWSSVSTLAAWRALGYESLNGINYGTTSSANLLNVAGFSPSSTGVGVPLENVTNFNLSPSSSAIAEGVLPWMVGVGPVSVDYHRSNFQSSNLVDAGASSYPQPAGSANTSPGPIVIQ